VVSLQHLHVKPPRARRPLQAWDCLLTAGGDGKADATASPSPGTRFNSRVIEREHIRMHIQVRFLPFPSTQRIDSVASN